MSVLGYKMLFRKAGITSSTLAIALLVAILASMSSIVNHISNQTKILGGYVNQGGTFIIVSRNSTSLTDSVVDVNIASIVNGTGKARYVLPQTLLEANLTTAACSYKIRIRCVDDLLSFLRLRRAYLNGTAARGYENQVVVGEILARLISIVPGDEVTLTLKEGTIKLTVAYVSRTLTESDAELIIPTRTINSLKGKSKEVSFIEFAPRENMEEALSPIYQLLPAEVKMVRVQQVREFVEDIEDQTLDYLALWSIAVYLVVAAASYVVTTRLIVESDYELTMLRVLGAERNLVFVLILAYTATNALLGAALGLTLGVAGTQIASTIARLTSIQLTPFLEADQAVQILLLTFASSILGCLYPAYESLSKDHFILS